MSPALRRTLLPAALAGLALAVPSAALAGPVLPPGAFDPKHPSSHYKGLLGTALRGDNALQSFAFDEDARQIYVLQTVTGKAEKRAGNMWLNRIDYSGKLLDSMRLNGFGHGASMGLSRQGSQVWVFVESQSASPDGGDGKGTRVARVVYRGGTTVASGTGAAKDVTPPGTAGKAPRPTVDPATGQLVVRYNDRKGVWGFLRVPIADALAGRWNRVTKLGSTPNGGGPRPGDPKAEIVSQGYAFAAGHAYLYYGDSYDHVKKPGDAYIRAVQLAPGKTVKGVSGTTASLKDLSFREPEGIAVQVNPGGAPRLVFGFASDPVTKPDVTKRFANFSYKQGFVPKAVPAPAPAPAPAPVPAPAPAPPPVAAPAPAPLVVHARRLNRDRLLRTRRIPVSIGGADVAAEVRVYAKFGRKLRRIYVATKTVRTARRTVTLRISKAQTRRLRRATGRVRLTISVRVPGQAPQRVHATVPRRR